MRFSALVLTLDEEQQIAGCLESLAPAESLLVLDCGSADRTREIAAAFPRTRVVERPFEDFADQRNHGLARFAPGEWVLHLDADERSTPALADELRGLAPAPEDVAFNLASRTYLGGRKVLRAAGFPVFQTRLTRAGAFAFEQVGHGQKAPAALGALPRLREPYDHHPFEKGFEHWRLRHERYAEQEVRSLLGGAAPGLAAALSDPIARRQWLKHASARLPLRPWLVWAYLMFARRGVLDGSAGWEYCRRRRLYEGMIARRLRPRRASG
jgi:glycosyltransferase involved in cell wall biosynthesis